MRYTIKHVRAEAARKGLTLGDWAPGDGVTRYRFFRPCNGWRFGRESEGAPCFCTDRSRQSHTQSWETAPGAWTRAEMIGPLRPEGDTYFGPHSAIYTALGAREAMAFLAGYR